MPSDIRILIVDDFTMIRAMLKKSLSEMGYKDTSEADDGVHALELLKAAAAESRPYDLVFVDWNMPRMTGIELIQLCKETPELSTTPFIVISAERDRKNLVRAMQAGAIDYILKPFTPQSLAEKIKTHLDAVALKPAANE